MISIDHDRKNFEKAVSIASKGINVRGDYYLIEAIAVESSDCELKPMLLIGDGTRYFTDEIIPLGNKTYKAVSPRSYPYKPYCFDLRIQLKKPNTEELFKEILAEFKKFVDLELKHQILLAASIMLSYVQEKFQTVPYIYLLGDNESGKTHTLKLIAELAYRPLYGVGIPTADLFTYLGCDGFTPTIIEDEIQGIEKDNDKAKVWKVGYKQGVKVPRIRINHNGERFIEYYDAFSLKFAAGEKLIRVRGLTERFIVVSMIEGSPEKDYYDEDDFERFAEIRNKLLLWRIDKLTDPMFGRLNSPWLKGRMRELYLPLLAVIKETQYYRIFEDFIHEKIKEREEIKRNSFEGFLTKIVAQKIGEIGKLEVEFIDIWAKIKEELNVEEHSARLDRLETDSYGLITKQLVGARLHEALGSETKRKRTSDGIKVFHVFDPTKLLKAIRKYHVTNVTDVIDFLNNRMEKQAQKSLGNTVET